MKSVAHSEEAIVENDFQLEMRKRAREIIAYVFGSNCGPYYELVEKVVSEIIIVNDDQDGFVEDEIAEQTANLVASHKWAKEAYDDDSPEATFTAYQVLYGLTEEERWLGLFEKLEELLRKRK